jgi:hypothetical protein
MQDHLDKAHFKIPFRGTTPIISSPAAGQPQSNANVPKVGYSIQVRRAAPDCRPHLCVQDKLDTGS